MQDLKAKQRDDLHTAMARLSDRMVASKSQSGSRSASAPSSVAAPEKKEENPFDVGYEGDGRVLKPGATYGSGGFEETSIEELDIYKVGSWR